MTNIKIYQQQRKLNHRMEAQKRKEEEAKIQRAIDQVQITMDFD